MPYDVAKLKKDMKLGITEWTLRDLLAYGTQEELVGAVLDRTLDGPARELAIRVLPIQALAVGIFDRLPLSMTHRGKIAAGPTGTTYYNDDGTVKAFVPFADDSEAVMRLRAEADPDSPLSRLRGSTDVVARAERIVEELAVLKDRSGPAVTK